MSGKSTVFADSNSPTPVRDLIMRLRSAAAMRPRNYRKIKTSGAFGGSPLKKDLAAKARAKRVKSVARRVAKAAAKLELPGIAA